MNRWIKGKGLYVLAIMVLSGLVCAGCSDGEQEPDPPTDAAVYDWRMTATMGTLVALAAVSSLWTSVRVARLSRTIDRMLERQIEDELVNDFQRHAQIGPPSPGSRT